MLSQWIRIFHSDNGQLIDYSLNAQNTDDIPFPFVASEDYLYIAQYYPFNNFFIELKEPNTEASKVLIDTWHGRQWTPAVDIIDATSVDGKSLAKTGVIQFSPDRRYRWQSTADTSDETTMGLSSLHIYNNSWLRVRFDQDLHADTEIKDIGYSFCTDEMLRAIDSEIDNYLMAWGGSTKLNWIEQIKLASLYLAYDLKAKGLIIHQGNILRFDDVSMACAHRTLMIIYAQLGESFQSKYQYSFNMYNELLSIKRFNFDEDMDGRLDKQEISNTVGKLIR
jgi:hypothetical protein